MVALALVTMAALWFAVLQRIDAPIWAWVAFYIFVPVGVILKILTVVKRSEIRKEFKEEIKQELQTDDDVKNILGKNL